MPVFLVGIRLEVRRSGHWNAGGVAFDAELPINIGTLDLGIGSQPCGALKIT